MNRRMKFLALSVSFVAAACLVDGAAPAPTAVDGLWRYRTIVSGSGKSCVCARRVFFPFARSRRRSSFGVARSTHSSLGEGSTADGSLGTPENRVKAQVVSLGMSR